MLLPPVTCALIVDETPVWKRRVAKFPAVNGVYAVIGKPKCCDRRAAAVSERANPHGASTFASGYFVAA